MKRINNSTIRKNHSNYCHRAQAIFDYVFLLLIIVAILLLMGYYIRNSLAGKFREGADVFGGGETYVPAGNAPDGTPITNPTTRTTTITNN
jgi:hypothetical protein